ncbi:zinc finger, CCHC-type containing protein [Tanacetum coccineum]
MGDENPTRTLGDYSRPSQEGYRNIIELPNGNNVVPLRFDTIRLVQNECSFHGLWSEDPNQHLKDVLKLVDSLDLNVANRERTRLNLFQFFHRDQASNWLERFPAGSISIWEDLTTRFLAQFFPSGRTVKLRNDILMFQQHQGESLSEAWTRFKDLHQKSLIMVSIFGSRSKSFMTMLIPPQGEPSINRPVNGNKSYPVGIVKNVEVHIGKLKLLEDLYVIDMEKDPVTPLLVGRGFLATTSAVIDCKKSKIAVGEGVTRSIFGVKEIDLGDEEEINRDVELNPFKDILMFRKIIVFLGAIPINLKGNMWESEELIEKRIDWNRPPKEGDGAWHHRIELIDPDGEKFNKTFQSIPTTRKLSEKENPSEIINLDHFHNS